MVDVCNGFSSGVVCGFVVFQAFSSEIFSVVSLRNFWNSNAFVGWRTGAKMWEVFKCFCFPAARCFLAVQGSTESGQMFLTTSARC